MPAHNEAEHLETNVKTLRAFLDDRFPFSARITVVDNASTDNTWEIAQRLANTLPGVGALHLERKGRGRALKEAWALSAARVVAYMDVDLATGLRALLPLVAPLIEGHGDVGIGTRLAPGARVVRGARRELLSRGYNLLVRRALGSSCSDAQCGFKAMRREVAVEVLPLVEDDEWFFDTELLVVAQRLGLRIHEVPVDWVDSVDSRVDILRTASDDLRGIMRLARGGTSRLADRQGLPWVKTRIVGSRPPTVELGDFPDGTCRLATPRGQAFSDELLCLAGVGSSNNLAYVALVGTLQNGCGVYIANLLAVVACSLADGSAYWKMTRANSDGMDRRHQAMLGLALTTVSLGVTTAAAAAARSARLGLVSQLVALAAANLIASLVRFSILREWVFPPDFAMKLTPACDVDAMAHRGQSGTPEYVMTRAMSSES